MPHPAALGATSRSWRSSPPTSSRWRDETAAGRTLQKDARAAQPADGQQDDDVFAAVLRFACRPESLGGFGLASNPAAYVEKLRENDRAALDYFEPDEIVAMAAALRAGRHRTDRMPAGGEHALAAHAQRPCARRPPRRGGGADRRFRLAFAVASSSACSGPTSTSHTSACSCGAATSWVN
jgi:hypothetical protein